MAVDAISGFVAKYMTEERILALHKREFGKYMAIFSEDFAKDIIEKETGIKCFDNEEDLNQSGYDLITDKGAKLQVKFRSVDGITPLSKQLNIETTRRKSKKNENKIGTGHVAYSSDEFDIIFVILIHQCKKQTEEWKREQRQPRNWSYVAIPVSEIINEEDGSILKTIIPSKTLRKYHDWKGLLNEYHK